MSVTHYFSVVMLLVAVALLIGSGSCFYSSGDDVEVLTPANFDSKVTNDDSIWVVEFYAPWYVQFLK